MVLNAIHMQGGTHSVPGGLLEPSNAGHAGIHLDDDGGVEAVPGSVTSSEHEEQQQVEEPPLVPLEPVVILHEPELLAVTATTASISWPAAEWSLPAHDDPRQTAFQQGVVYSLLYELQVQQVDLGPPSDTASAEQLLQQVYPALNSSNNWRSVSSVVGPMQVPVQVTMLRSGRFYAARVVATATAVVEGSQQPVAFAAATSQVLPFRTLPTPPGQMQAPALAQRARNALKLKWNVPDETGGEAIQRYELLVTPQPAGWDGPPADEQGFTQVYVGDERSYKLGKLGPGQRFSFKIRSFNVLGGGPWSLPSTFTTQASVPAQPDPPVQVASSKDAATLQWRPPADNGAVISCYQLEVDDGRGGEFRLAFTGLDTQCVVAKLQSGLNYRFRLRTENSEGYSMWSTAVAAATAATTPGCPTGLAAVGINRSSVTLTWQPPSSDGGSQVLAYQVQLLAKTKVAAAALGSDWVIIFDGAAVATTFSALQPGCEYMVRAAARNAAGQGSFCMPLRLTTAPDVPLQPPKPEAEAAATSLLLRWAAPQHDGGSQVTGYKVEMRCSPDASSSTAAIGPQHSLAIPEHFLNIYAGPDMCVQVTDLLPGTAYEYRAAALNSHGAGPWSVIGTATTLPAAPLPPPAPQLAACSSSSLSVTWVEPYGQGSPVSSYTLNMARLGPVGGSGSGANGVVHAMANGTADGSGQQHPDSHDDAASSCSSSHSADKVRWETVYTGPLTSAEVRQLKPACRYMLRVRAHNSIGGSNWGEALTATTSPAAPCQPASLTSTAVSSCAILLRWSAPLEDNGAAVTSYQLEMATAAVGSSSSSWNKVYQGSSVEYQHCSGLLPGRSYSWRVRAFNSCGAGAWTEPVKGCTFPAEPGVPAKPSFSQRTATSVKVKWGLPQEENGSAVTSYVLEIRQLAAGADVQQQQQQQGQAADPAQQQQQWLQAYRGPELSQKVTGLQPGSSYEFRVAAANAVGLGCWSDSSSVEVLKRPPPPPASVSAELEGGADAAAAAGGAPACLLVSWPAAEAAADSADAVGYEVEAAPALGSSHAVLRSNVAKQTSTSISSGLQLGVTYNVRVRSVGAAGTGHSSWSAAVSVTMPAAPAAPASEGDSSESGLALAPASAAEAGAGKRKSKGKSKASVKDAAAAAEKRSSKVAAVANVTAKGKPRKLGLKDHVLSQLPPPVSRWLRKNSKYVKYGIAAAAVLAVLVMIVLASLGSRGGDAPRGGDAAAQAAFMQMQQQMQMQAQQRMQEQQLHNMHAQGGAMPQPLPMQQ